VTEGGGDPASSKPATDPDHPAHSDVHSLKELPERLVELGSFIREQRSSARLSLRRLSELAGISNPYLSQIERGLRRPSAEILQQIAKALRISAETLYVQAGILERPDGDTDLSRHIFADPHLTEEQRQALMRIYLSFRHENEDQDVGRDDVDTGGTPTRSTRHVGDVEGVDSAAGENGGRPPRVAAVAGGNGPGHVHDSAGAG
jgi:transcriptional regulator with XRE-family HTH domain